MKQMNIKPCSSARGDYLSSRPPSNRKIRSLIRRTGMKPPVTRSQQRTPDVTVLKQPRRGRFWQPRQVQLQLTILRAMLPGRRKTHKEKEPAYLTSQCIPRVRGLMKITNTARQRKTTARIRTHRLKVSLTVPLIAKPPATRAKRPKVMAQWSIAGRLRCVYIRSLMRKPCQLGRIAVQ